MASSAIFRRVTIRSKPSSLMANYIKNKRGELMWSHLATAVEGNWIPEEWEDIENIGKRIRKLEKEVKGKSDEDNGLKGKMT